MVNIHQSARLYEDWLREQLHGAVVKKDLARKRDKMKENAFVFHRQGLRAPQPIVLDRDKQWITGIPLKP